jgi:ATP-dependent DNA helicase RecQ
LPEEPALLDALRRYWGYESFRPLQERIIRSLVAGHDAAVVMPTGGGKSLCYQLPAVVSGKTAVVISPLISLMQDQAAQLAQMGIPAAVLNSSLASDQQSRTMREAIRGAYRLLYLSPERLARVDCQSWLERVPVAFFAIDEAHCISEWGHEFRPEYRQLRRLRERFPELPIAAFTASATRRVRHDILEQLGLRDPHKYIASFHRPNLRYLVHEVDAKSHGNMLVRAVRAHAGENVIVYSPTVKQVEETVDFLGDRGIAAVPYHGQMDTPLRQRNQETWMSDEVRVLVGTLAFGLGINKPGVRAVIHLALPKSVEQYYQEAGRAGRDGEYAECVLFWRNKDVGLLAYFIDQISDPGEKERAWQRYHAMKKYVSDVQCRHRQICLHFGETPKWVNCGMCDVCSGLPDWLITQKAAPKEAPSRKPTLVLKKDARQVRGASAVDPGMVEFLRDWRRRVAQARQVSAFIVMTDATLLDLCAKHPGTLDQLAHVTGMGAKKIETYGEQILETLARFGRGERAHVTPQQSSTSSHADETLKLIREGCSLEEIARRRERKLITVVGTVATLVEQKKVEFRKDWVRPGLEERIEAAASEVGYQWLKPLEQRVPEATPEEVRLIVAKLRARQ